jgi:hypothetical protein
MLDSVYTPSLRPFRDPVCSPSWTSKSCADSMEACASEFLQKRVLVTAPPGWNSNGRVRPAAGLALGRINPRLDPVISTCPFDSSSGTHNYQDMATLCRSRLPHPLAYGIMIRLLHRRLSLHCLHRLLPPASRGFHHKGGSAFRNTRCSKESSGDGRKYMLWNEGRDQAQSGCS